MSETSMAAAHSFPASSSNLDTTTSHEHDRVDLESIRVLVVSVNYHILRFLEDPEARKSLQLRCTSKLKIRKQEFFEFSEHSVLSNLYWGILNVEAAIQAKWPEERDSRLKNSEHMLQVPALLEEHGSTGGIQNRYLVCCSYFYLSLVRKLQRDEWQVTLHFLQALLIFPRLVRTDFAPWLWESAFFCGVMSENNGMGGQKSFKSQSLTDDAIDEMTRQQARRYKDWLMYYRVISYGETPQWHPGCSVAPSLRTESQSFMFKSSSSNRDWDSTEDGSSGPFPDVEESLNDGIIEMPDGAKASIVAPVQKNYTLKDDEETLLKKLNEVYNGDKNGKFGLKCLQDMLEESQTPISIYSHSNSGEVSDSENQVKEDKFEAMIRTIDNDDKGSDIINGELDVTCSISSLEYMETSSAEGPKYPTHEGGYEGNTSNFSVSGSLSSISDLNSPFPELRYNNSNSPGNWRCEDDHLLSKAQKQHCFSHMGHEGCSTRKKQVSSSRKNLGEISLNTEKSVYTKIVGKQCFSEWIGKCEDGSIEFSIIWEIFNNKSEETYEMLQDVILEQLLNVMSTSKEEKILRKSVSILSSLILENRNFIEEIKEKGLCLCDLATALKRNVHEAAILLYLINPLPAELNALELLPALLEVAFSSNNCEGGLASPLLTPPAASLKMIDVLVTALDDATNNMHLAVISSSQVLSRLVHVARKNNIEQNIYLTSILVKCMRFDGQCRTLILQFTPMAPFIHLLTSPEKQAKFIALQFFHEILCIPRSSANSLLHQIRGPDSTNIVHTLISCIQQSEPEYKLMAANLLVQLDILEGSSCNVFRDEAMEVLLESVSSEENTATQTLSASILSNLGGTYAWTGDSYTLAWMITKAGITSLHHRNMIKGFNWSDECLQDGSTDAWCSKIARSFIKMGEPVFYALEKGLRSKIKGVSRDCLVTLAWLGCQFAVKGPTNLRYSACEILLSGLEQFLHPGSELDERVLACLCVYNYASGKGMQKLVHFSEGVRESLRRLSSVTWMAEELLKVTDYFLQTKSRVSCVHTQILEAGNKCSGAVNALIYYKGQLYSGHSDGSIKVWDIKGQIAKLVWDVKEHKKAVTCFTLYEPGNSLLSGSSDGTIRIWKLVKRELECSDVIKTREPVHNIETFGQLIFLVTPSRGLKVFDASRYVNTICKSKHVKCTTVVQRKLYLGCQDSSIQEIDITNYREREIKAPSKSWQMQKRPVNSVLPYKNWIYGGSSSVQGSNIKDWINRNEPKMSIQLGKGTNVQIMGVVEDFIYLNCSSSPSILQIWLRETQQKVGRLSAGSKITSLLTANDIVLCGTETGLIKGWIPL